MAKQPPRTPEQNPPTPDSQTPDSQPARPKARRSVRRPARPASSSDAAPEAARDAAPAAVNALTEPPPDTRESVSMSSEPSEEDIRLRAYHRYLERGGSPGMDFDDWLQAERELTGKRTKSEA